jgi:hypothetical protein
MKKISLLVLVLLGFKLSAQVVITQSNFPTAGTTITRNVDKTKVEFNPGVPGPGNVWNYGGLNADTTVTYNFVSPASTPYAAQYPTATLALESAQGLYAYLKVDNAAAEELGFAGDAAALGLPGVNIKFKYNSPLTFIPFPAQLNTSFVDSAKGEITLPGSAVGAPFDSVKVKRKVVRTGNFDASGSLTVNTQSWQDALRYKRLEQSVDSFFVLFMGNWQDASGLGVPPTSNTDLFYEWYVNGQNYPVLTATMNSIGDSAVTRKFYAPTTSKSSPQTTITNLYPNPASDVLYFTGDFANAQTIVIYNALGQKQDISSLVQPNQITTYVNNLSNGIYSYQILDKNSKVISTGKFVIQR